MTKMVLQFVLAGRLGVSGLASAQNIRVDIPAQPSGPSRAEVAKRAVIGAGQTLVRPFQAMSFE